MTAKRESAAGWRWVVVAVVALAASGAATATLALWFQPNGTTLRDALAATPLPLAAIIVLPFVATWLGAFARPARRERQSGARSAARASQAESAAPLRSTPAPTPGAAALRLLALLQQEGRFVDFLEEDLGPHSDEQIGAAVRSIHEGCRAALRDRMELKPVLPAAEGATVTVERGFDPAAVRVTGNVRGEPPYRGVVRHPGWRSESVRLPDSTGDADPSILAPAEVEVL